jgi:hypothetical protein
MHKDWIVRCLYLKLLALRSVLLKLRNRLRIGSCGACKQKKKFIISCKDMATTTFASDFPA